MSRPCPERHDPRRCPLCAPLRHPANRTARKELPGLMPRPRDRRTS